MIGARSQISSSFMPPEFMDTRRASKSRTLMQSWLSSINLALKSAVLVDAARSDSDSLGPAMDFMR